MAGDLFPRGYIALALAAMGWRVFPVWQNSKLPAIARWPQRATTDPEKIKKWWSTSNYNIGIATGRADDAPEGTLYDVAIDYDFKDLKEGRKAFGIHAAKGLTNTYRVKTPNGIHCLWKSKTPIGNSVSRVAKHVDVRGIHGYIVAQGSVVNDKTYSYLTDSAAKPAMLPPELERLALTRSATEPVATVIDINPELLDSDAAVERGKAWVINDAPDAVEGSGGDTTTFAVAQRLRAIGLSQGKTLEIMKFYYNEQRCFPPWEDEELAQKVANAFVYARKPPGYANPDIEFGTPLTRDGKPISAHSAQSGQKTQQNQTDKASAQSAHSAPEPAQEPEPAEAPEPQASADDGTSDDGTGKEEASAADDNGGLDEGGDAGAAETHQAGAGGSAGGNGKSGAGTGNNNAGPGDSIPNAKPLRRRILRLLDMSTWDTAEVPARLWAVVDRIPLLQVGLITGEGGGGKSVIELQRCICHAAGLPWLGIPVEQRPAFYLGGEDDKRELQIRAMLIARHMGLKFKDLTRQGFQILPGGETKDPPTLIRMGRDGKMELTKLFEALMEHCLDAQPIAIVLDPLALIYAASELDRGQVYWAVAAFRQLARASNGSVTLIGHPSLTGISSGSGLSGSTAWHGAPRFRLYLEMIGQEEGSDVPDNGRRLLKFLKSQYSARGPSIELIWKAGLYIPVTELDRQARAQLVVDIFVNLLSRFMREKRDVSDNPRAGNYAPSRFAVEREAKEGNVSKENLEEAMRTLMREGKVIVETYKAENRHIRKRLIVAPGQGCADSVLD
jgi:RecA-family ATPase